MAEDEPTVGDIQAAMGLAAHAMVAEILAALRIKGVFSDADCAKVIDNALVSTENLDAMEQTPALRLARQLLETHSHRWSPGGVAKK